MQAFTTFLRRKYEPIAVEEVCVTYMVEAGRRIFPEGLEKSLGAAHTPEEVNTAALKEGKNKAPGKDGVGLEF